MTGVVDPAALRHAWLQRQALGLCVAAVVLLTLFETTALDPWLAERFYDATTHDFPWRHAWFFDALLHHGLKAVSVAGGLIAAGAALAGAFGLWPQWPRRNALAAALGMLLIPLGTTLLKQLTHRHCPWDLLPFGGFVPYTSLLSGAPAGIAAGQCFPAGHASGGFVWMVWGVMLRPLQPRVARRALGAGLALGGVMGLGRMAQGAHFLSHTLWSAWFAWAVIVALAGLCRVALTGPQPHDGGPCAVSTGSSTAAGPRSAHCARRSAASSSASRTGARQQSSRPCSRSG